jgi:Ca2+-binding RTX toxin-like protein
LNGFSENDELYGQGGSDRLFGGLYGDGLIGGAGKDALNGGALYDYYYFGNGWGKDSITDSAISGNEIGNALYFRLPSYEGYVRADLTIRLTPGDGPEVKDKSATNTINWELASLFESVEGGAGDDEIKGDALANDIDGHTGADTIYGGGGDDYIRADDGSGGDVVDCGEDLFGGADNDDVYYDLGDEIASDCENQILIP